MLVVITSINSSEEEEDVSFCVFSFFVLFSSFLFSHIFIYFVFSMFSRVFYASTI